MTRVEIPPGTKYGSFTVIEFAGVKNGKAQYLCKCDCGNTIVVDSYALRHRDNPACFNCHNIGMRMKKHGMYETRLYNCWENMMARCYNSNSHYYKHYGQRGITVCEKWHDSKCFIDWALQNGYQDDLTLDRIDVNGNYEPLNCRWATVKQQQNNRRDCIYVDTPIGRMTLKEVSENYGINYGTLRYRWKVGKRGEELLAPKYGMR